MPSTAAYQILRSDGLQDRLAGQTFDHYDEAYDVLEKYDQDVCCSDERVVYQIVAAEGAGS